ncbi:DUF3667 domain-containing protein [Sphingomonas bacterium]|uniref:DUF3667 domain-containing protein n=1 Tax=Sphingomonas bacterium TaxID=1895847 RepID=UPI001575CF6C|nr:DUF3667 domain-containing protein [Sphingomonas bacterium]
MHGELSAIGDVMTGAVGARTIEPRAGEAGHGHGNGICLNCGTRLTGGYCHACGQSAEVHRSVGAIGHEIAHGVFHFEGKVWRTLPLLVLHPGALTRRYIAGERARFVSPLALFLFTVFLLFATISWMGWDGARAAGDATAATTQVASAQAADRAGVQLARERQVRQQLALAGQPTTHADASIAALQATIDGIGLMQDKDNAGGLRGIAGKIHTGWARLDEGIGQAAANPALAIYKLQSSAYKYSWTLIPLSTPFVALLFLWRRRFTLYDHAIFVTYSIAFMMMLMIVLTIAGAIGVDSAWIGLAATVVPPVHMFVQLRGAYSLGKTSAAWRTVVLLTFSFTVLLGFAALLLIHGLMD